MKCVTDPGSQVEPHDPLLSDDSSELDAGHADDFPYDGEVGRTWLESIHVTIPGGVVRSVQVYRGVNVTTDPHLREPTVTGALHRFETGEQLAIPFVFHDPDARKFALVVPEVLRHEELRERSRLLQRMANDTVCPIPPYVREANVVIGVPELIAYLEAPSHAARAKVGAELDQKRAQLDQHQSRLSEHQQQLSEHAAALDGRKAEIEAREGVLAERERALEARHAELEERAADLAGREERLMARAEQVLTREDDQRLLVDQIEAEKRELSMREADLEARFEVLRQREVGFAQDRASFPEGVQTVSEAEIQEIDDVEGLIEDLDELRPPRAREPSADPGAPEKTSPAVDLGAVGGATGGRAGDRPIEDDRRPDDPTSELQEDEITALVDDLEEVVEADVHEVVDADVHDVHEVHEVHEVVEAEDADVEEIEDIDEVATGVGPRPSKTETAEDELLEAKTSIAIEALAPEVTPPDGFLEQTHREMIATYHDGRVWLFAKLDEGREEAFRGDNDLLAQMVVVEGYPVVLLTLVENLDDDARPYVRRAALDPSVKDDRRILEHLRRNFAASVALFGHAGTYERTLEVEAPRAQNVHLLVERVSRFREEPQVDAHTAIERALEVPPPLSFGDHPFHDAPAGGSAKSAVEAVGKLADWTKPDKLDRALLALSIPRDVVEGATARILRAALAHGIALPSALLAKAVALGLVEGDPGDLVQRQIEAFAELSRTPGRGALSAEDLASNWEQLLSAASDNEVAIDEETHRLAWTHIRAVRPESVPPAEDVDEKKLPEMGEMELVILLEHPTARRAAALELCRREKPELATTLYKAIRKMPRADVVRIVPVLTKMGEEVGDALIDGLTARKTFVRQASALALGHLKLRRAVVPLVHLLQNEPSEVWQEVARVLGIFGTATLRTLTRAMKDPRGQEERFSYALAMLAEHGCERQVSKLQDGNDRSVAKMALEAMTTRDVVEKHCQAVQGEREVEAGDGIRAFSLRFYQELEGRAPEGDLGDPGES